MFVALILACSGPAIEPNGADVDLVMTIPVVVHHVVRDDGTGVALDTTAEDLVDRANAYFADSRVEFEVVDELTLEHSGIYETDDVDDAEMAAAVANREPDRVNMFLVGSLGGWYSKAAGLFPVFLLTYDRADSELGPNHLGHVLAEALGARHTWSENTAERADGSNCGRTGDRLCDTPADPGFCRHDDCSPLDCGVDANGDAYVPDLTNMMADWSVIECRERFSEAQQEKMRTRVANRWEPLEW